MKTLALTILSDNTAHAPFVPEHGLSLALEMPRGGNLLFDTGCGETFFPHLEELKKDLKDFAYLFLSHGHYDHTGALAPLLEKAPHLEVLYGLGAEKERWSCHPGLPPKNISMPEECRGVLLQHPLKKAVDSPLFLENGLILTGPIPRETTEDTGGPFFLAPDKKEKDEISDETALLWEGGVLFQGCCHAGIGNTLSFCRKRFAKVPIHTIVGGLHLKNASSERLERTASYLRESGIKRLLLLHCTGETGMEYLKKALPFLEILTPSAGESFILGEDGSLQRNRDPKTYYNQSPLF